MDDFDPNLSGLNTEETSSSKLPLLALALAVIGMATGITGIIMANGTNKKISELEATIKATPDQTPKLQAAIKDIEDRLVLLGSELVKLNKQDRQIRDDSQEAFNNVSTEIKENRTKINELVGKFEESLKKLETVKSTPAPKASGGSSDGPSQVAENGIHLIRSGDTMSGIAKQYGVNLSDLMSANPSVNPRALQIGQRIVIP